MCPSERFDTALVLHTCKPSFCYIAYSATGLSNLIKFRFNFYSKKN